MPRGWKFPIDRAAIDYVTPFVPLFSLVSPSDMNRRDASFLSVVGRLKPGVRVSEATADVQTIAAQLAKQYPEENAGRSERVFPLRDDLVRRVRPAMIVLLGAVTLVLLIACANVANLLLARSAAREREIAIRIALGASRGQLVRQLLIETCLLSIIGGAAGLLLAWWSVDALVALGPRNLPRLDNVSVDTRVVGFTLALSVLTSLAFGIVPALASVKPELTEALKEGGRGSTSGLRRNRLRNALVVAEMALALVLLVSAGLLMKSFVRLQNVDPGFNPKNVLTMEITLPVLKYPKGKPVADFYAEVERRLKTISGMEHIGLTSILPLSGSNSDNSFHIEGVDSKQTGVYPDEELRAVSPDYFHVLQTALLKGRFFTAADSAEGPQVVIINQAMAKKYWHDEDALGKRINFDDSDPQNIKWVTVVGIVADIRHRGLDLDPKPEYYLPHAQRSYRGMVIALRSSQDPRALVPGVRRELQSLDPDLPLANIRTLEQVAAESIAPRRLSVTLLGVFAGIALVLASVGIYGVMSFLVVQRTHEMGVRMALGAQPGDVLRLVVGHGIKLVAIGTVVGLVISLFSSRALGAMLYNVAPFDLVTFAGVTITLALVAFLASYIPALRATRADPMIALGHG